MNQLYNKSIWDKPESQNFLKAILSLQNSSDAKTFLADILTPAEIKEFSSRLKAAQMLKDKQKYLDIQKATGLSTTTIARISNWFQNGAGGYATIISRLNHTHTKPEHAG